MTTWFQNDPFPGAETWLEERYQQVSGGDDLKFIKVAALISLAFGVSGPAELLLASGGMLAQYYSDSDGIDGVISALTGVQLAKRKYTTMAFPAMLESYKLLKDFQKDKTVTKQSLTRTSIFVVGWLAARYKYV